MGYLKGVGEAGEPRILPTAQQADRGTARIGSGAGAQTGQSDGDEPPDCGLGRQAAGCCEGVEAVARELLGCDVVPDIAVFGGLGKQVPNEVADVLLRLGDALVAMKESRELVVAVPAGLVGDEREGLEHRRAWA
jgi:hypothetical protein